MDRNRQVSAGRDKYIRWTDKELYSPRGRAEAGWSGGGLCYDDEVSCEYDAADCDHTVPEEACLLVTSAEPVSARSRNSK